MPWLGDGNATEDWSTGPNSCTIGTTSPGKGTKRREVRERLGCATLNLRRWCPQ